LRHSAGSPWGIAPPGLPQIRTCPIKASGSSRCGFAVPHTIRPPCGDTRGGSMPSVWFQLPVYNAAPPSLHGVREGPFPRFHTTMRRSDSRPLVSPHFVAFVWRYHPCASFAPSGQARGRGLRGVGVPVPEPDMSVETDGAPKFLGTPRVPWPCSPTPVGSVTPGHSGAPTRSPRLTRARTPTMIFRGSIARPGHSLSTLRREGYPSTAQDSLPAAGQALPGGIR